MKLVVTVAISATLALSSADTACDITLLAPQAEDPNVIQCSADSGFTIVPPSIPSAEVIAKMCSSNACLNSLAALESFGLGDCLLLDTLHLETDLIDPIKAACNNSTAGSSSTAGSAGAADNSTITIPTKTNEASGSSSSAGGDAEVGSSSASGSENGASQNVATLAVATMSLAAAALYL